MIDADGERDALAHLERGDRRGALVRLVELYGAAVHDYCLRVLRDDALAHDTSQQVFLEVHRDLPSFRREASLWTWIARIAHNRCMDAASRRRREQQRTVSLDAEELMNTPETREPHPDALTERTRWLQALERCLARLSEPVRATVLMRYLHGWSFDEMADAAGERAGTLQVRVSRALPILRKCLERAGVEL